MKNTIKVLLSIILTAAIVVAIAPAEEVKAAVSEDLVELIFDQLIDNATVSDFSIGGETMESFGLSKYATYGFIAQRYCYSYNCDTMSKLPSQKKAIAWLKGVYCEIAKQYPDQAEELAEAFLDGRGENWSYKKKASWDFFEATIKVLSYYKNEGVYFGYADFDLDFTRFNRGVFGNDLTMRDCIHSRWANYSNSKKYLSRIECLEGILKYGSSTNGTGALRKNYRG